LFQEYSPSQQPRQSATRSNGYSLILNNASVLLQVCEKLEKLPAPSAGDRLKRKGARFYEAFLGEYSWSSNI